ncbi:hypothetical protein MTR_0120s0020 [Medicago truncatula]|uniref:Uncharacterized protein n=1 Tax=Medicago truncatula TaxID=3880 RepID=A0A072TID3_MEDTR|nr:hypothetical protein MTR_0120s0020 [Medicago truncatula]
MFIHQVPFKTFKTEFNNSNTGQLASRVHLLDMASTRKQAARRGELRANSKQVLKTNQIMAYNNNLKIQVSSLVLATASCLAREASHEVALSPRRAHATDGIKPQVHGLTEVV